MKNINNNKIIALVIILMFGWFYWFQWRPTNIRKECVKKSGKAASEFYQDNLEQDWQNCRNSKYRTDCSFEENKLNTAKARGTYLIKNYDNFYEGCLNANGINK